MSITSADKSVERFTKHLQTILSSDPITYLSKVWWEYHRFLDNSEEISEASLQERRLSEVLHALGNCTFKWLVLDHVTGVELMSSEGWDSFFNSLLSNQCCLEHIEIHCRGPVHSIVCSHVGAFLARSSTLEYLDFRHPYGPSGTSSVALSHTAVRLLTEGLVRTKCLRELYVNIEGVEIADVLTSAFTGDLQNTSIKELYLSGPNWRWATILPLLLVSSSQNLKKVSLCLDWEEVTENHVDEFRNVYECLRTKQYSTIEADREIILHLFCVPDREFTEEQSGRIFLCLDSWANASEHAPMLKSELFFTCRSQKEGEFMKWVIRTIKRYSHLKAMGIALIWEKDAVVDSNYFSLLMDDIQSNESIESLRIDYRGSEASLDRRCWTQLFLCLRHKRGLKLLGFGDQYATDNNFRSLMDLLQVNIYLEEVGCLTVRRWQAEGKFVLVYEALRRNKAQASYFSILRDARLPFEDARAGRIFLCGNPHAGKTRLRASMLETWQKTSRVQKQMKKFLGRLKRTKGVDVELLRDDDQMQVSIWDLAGQEIFRALQTILLPTITQACIFVFVFSPIKADHQQSERKDDLEEAFGDELGSWLRFVSSNYPVTGTFLPEVLVIITHRDQMKMYKLEESCDWAERKVKHFRDKYQQALNLHEKVYYVDAQDVKEVSPFTEDVFQLFSEMLQRRTPQAPSVCLKLNSEIWKRPEEVTSQPVWQIQKFYTFVSQRLEALGVGHFDPEVESEKKVLEAVSQYMHDVGSIFFLPHCQLVVVDINWLTHTFLGSLISEGHGFEVKPGTETYRSPDGYVTKFKLDEILVRYSRRSQAIYHQIRFRKEMMERKEINDKTFVCERDLIRLDWNGYFIIVEYDSLSGDHVDILVRVSRYKGRQEAICFLKEQILERFRAFCASPEGCRGVTLVTAIIRPECVERLTPQKYRECQVVLETELKEKLETSVMENSHLGEIISPGGDEREPQDSLLNYEHTWPRKPEADLSSCCQLAVELLEEKDVNQILEFIQKKKEVSLQNLREMSKELDHHLKDRGGECQEQVDPSRLEENQREEGSQGSWEGRLLRQMEIGFTRVHNHLDEMQIAWSQQLEKICDLQKESRCTYLSVMRKIDEMICYSEAREIARLPRRPFISLSNVGLRERISGLVQVGTPVRLHLMCESISGSHIVEDQPGLELMIGDKNKEWLRHILVYSSRVFWFLLKAGIQVTLGAGNVIPELADLSLETRGGLVLSDMTLDELKRMKSLPLIERSEMVEEMWVFLKNELLREKNVTASFKLYLVKYNRGIVAVEDSYAWLCKKCVEKGQKNRILRMF